MEMPGPTEHHRKLQAFAGDWDGDEKMHPSPWDPKGGPAKATTQGRVDMDGMWLVQDYTQERGGKITYRGHGVFGYDPGQGCYTMHWFDSMTPGAGSPARGKWEGNTVRFEQSSAMGHARYTYIFDSPERMRFLLEHSRDGKEWSPFVEGNYRKR